MTADDLFTGLFGALAKRGFTTFSLRSDGVDRAVESVYEQLQEWARDAGMNLRFRIVRDQLHGDSVVVRDALGAAAQRNLISIDNPEFMDIRLKRSAIERSVDMSRLPGGAALYEQLATVFIDGYEPPTQN